MAKQYPILRATDYNLRAQIGAGLDDLSVRVGGPDDGSPPVGPALRRGTADMVWIPGEYYEGDVVEHDGWLMTANKTTTDPPAPQDLENPTWISEITGIPGPFTINTIAEPVYITGNRFHIFQPLRIRGYRWYCPDASGNFTFEVWSADTAGNVQQLIGPTTPTAVGWIEIPYNFIAVQGLEIDLMVGVRSVTQPNSFASLWQIKNGNSNPGEGEAYFRNNATEIRVHNTDKNDVDQAANLALIEVGGTMEFSGSIWTITNITTTGSGASGRHNFFITPNQGRPSENETIITWTWGSSDPVPYAVLNNWWAGEDNADGFEDDEYPPAGINDNFYGTDILADLLVASDDWDFMAYTFEADPGGGGGGVARNLSQTETTVLYSIVASGKDPDGGDYLGFGSEIQGNKASYTVPSRGYLFRVSIGRTDADDVTLQLRVNNSVVAEWFTTDRETVIDTGLLLVQGDRVEVRVKPGSNKVNNPVVTMLVRTVL